MLGASVLSSRFGLVGAFVGKFPKISIILSLIITAPAFIGVFYRFNLNKGMNEGFIDNNAPSHSEVFSQRQFFGKSNEQWYLALFGISKVNKGMLDQSNYNEFNSFYKYVTETLNISYKVEAEEMQFKYVDICQPLCDINDQLQKLMENQWLATMRYPVSQVLSYDVNIGKHVFNRTYDNTTGDLIDAHFLAYYLTVFLDDDIRKQQVDIFETTVSQLAKEHTANKSSKVEIFTHGSGSVMGEMQRSVVEWLINVLYGHILGIATLLIINWFSGWLSEEGFSWRRVLLAIISVVVVLNTTFSAIGYLLLCGYAMNLLFITSPIITLVFVINAHGTFLIADSWNRLYNESIRKQFTASERLAACFEQISLSYLMSHLIIFAAFFVVHFFLITNYAAFALCLALCILFNLIYQTLFFSALLVMVCYTKNNEYCHETSSKGFIYTNVIQKPSIIKLNEFSLNDSNTMLKPKPLFPAPNISRHQNEVKKSGLKRRQFRVSFLQKLFYPFSKFLSSTYAEIAISLLAISFIWFGVHQSVNHIENRMDYRDILPSNSPSIRAFNLMDSVWKDILQIVYIVDKPPNFEDPKEFKVFQEFITEATNITHVMQSNAHMSWVFDYYRDQLNTDYFSINNNFTFVNMTRFKSFISGFPYSAWQSGVHYVFKNTTNQMESPQIDKMVVLVAYNETYGLAGKLRLMRECRRVASHYPEFKIISFDTDSQTVDVIDSVPLTGYTVLLFLLTMGFAATFIIMCHTVTTVVTTISIASIIINFYGLANAFLGFNLDLLTVPLSWPVLAQTIYVGIQFIGEFIHCWAKEDRQRRALEYTASPIWKTTLIWIVLVLPQYFSTTPFFVLQPGLQILGVGISICHAMLYLPVTISLFSNCFGLKPFQ